MAAQKNLSPDRARKLIEATVNDVVESNLSGSLPSNVLKRFFEQAAGLVDQPTFSKLEVDNLVTKTVKEVAAASGEVIPNSSTREWSLCRTLCGQWLC